VCSLTRQPTRSRNLAMTQRVKARGVREDAAMENVLTALRHTRAQLKERGIDALGGALGRVRSGALDWHETLKARRAELDANEPKWLGWAALQRRVIDGVDRVLVRFSDRVRSEMKRLSGLELPEVIEVSEPAKLVERAE